MDKPIVNIDITGASYITEYDIKIRKHPKGKPNYEISNKEQAEKIMLALFESLSSECWTDCMELGKKLYLYGQDKYSVPVPPVSTANWNALDWIAHIDNCGQWEE